MRTLKQILLLAAFLTSQSMVSQAAQLKVGEPFPTILLPTLDGNRSQSIEDFRGQKLMMHIFASW